MKRTLEKLGCQRREKEDDFKTQLAELKNKGSQLQKLLDSVQSYQSASRPNSEPAASPGVPEEKHKRAFRFLTRPSRESEADRLMHRRLLPSLAKTSQIIEQNLLLNKEILSSLTGLLETGSDLMDARDKEWDALGSNHVGQIFKSLEWRVDKLAADYKTSSLLMKKFMLLEEKLNELLALLEDKRAPSSRLIKDVLAPLEDWRYTCFEYRYRGSEEEVVKQLEIYLPFFKKGKKVLDLGCGRGEFLSLLKKNGIEAEGADINQQMVDICRDKGLNCTKADILELLAAKENSSLGGIFSSQVIEHMAPAYLKRVIELAHHKLAPTGCIVLETVNPTSVFALVQIYFLDLSHRQPIHPQALRFLLENSGFEDVEIQYSSELDQEKLENLPQAGDASTILNRNFDKLNAILFSAPNYAGIGIKK